MTRGKSLVQAVELWYPQGEVMAFGAGAYRGNDELRRAREATSFHQGEGLPRVAGAFSSWVRSRWRGPR